VYVSASGTPIRNLKVWGEASAGFVFNGDYPYYSNTFGYGKSDADEAITAFKDNGNIQVFLKPEAEYNLSSLTGLRDNKFHVYTKLLFNTSGDDKYARGDAESPFIVESVAFRFGIGRLNALIQGVELTGGLDNENEDYLYNSYSLSVRFPWKLGINTGALIRIAQSGVGEHDNPLGFFLGMTKEISGFGNPRLWGQFYWNAQPYKGFEDGAALNFGDYMIDDPQGMSGLACIRLGLTWDF
jgi:hypothetical protein